MAYGYFSRITKNDGRVPIYIACYRFFVTLVGSITNENARTNKVAYLLYKEIFTRYGTPRTLVSDRGQNFMSKVVQALFKNFQVTRHVTSSYHPQSNVACERMNSTLAQSLRAYCQENPSSWDKFYLAC